MKERLIEILKNKYNNNKAFSTSHHTNYEILFDNIAESFDTMKELDLFVKENLVKGLMLFASSDKSKISFFVDLGDIDGL